MRELDQYLDFAIALARDAGDIMHKYFMAQEIGIEIKPDQTPVTLADKEVNSLVISRVKVRFPEHGILGEEESYEPDRAAVWVVDPVDGTSNFASRIPLFAFSMALVENGEAKVAVVYDPIMDRLFSAMSGRGAYEGEKKLDISARTPSQKLQISSWVVGGIENSVFEDIGINGKISAVYDKNGNIKKKDIPIAYALAVVAAGDYDAMISSIKTPWDVAAGGLIAKEAGAKVSDIFGNEIRQWNVDVNGILAAPPVIHDELYAIIKPVVENA